MRKNKASSGQGQAGRAGAEGKGARGHGGPARLLLASSGGASEPGLAEPKQASRLGWACTLCCPHTHSRRGAAFACSPEVERRLCMGSKIIKNKIIKY